jgi:hypothetical protein
MTQSPVRARCRLRIGTFVAVPKSRLLGSKTFEGYSACATLVFLKETRGDHTKRQQLLTFSNTSDYLLPVRATSSTGRPQRTVEFLVFVLAV